MERHGPYSKEFYQWAKRTPKLTERQRQVVALYAKHMFSHHKQSVLGIKASTIREHRNIAYEKYKASRLNKGGAQDAGRRPDHL